jgi:hypothetical protein
MERTELLPPANAQLKGVVELQGDVQRHGPPSVVEGVMAKQFADPLKPVMQRCAVDR